MGLHGYASKLTFFSEKERKELKFPKACSIKADRVAYVNERLSPGYIISIIYYILFDILGHDPYSSNLSDEIDIEQLKEDVYKPLKEFRKKKPAGTALKEFFEPPEIMNNLANRYNYTSYDSYKEMSLKDKKDLLEEIDQFIHFFENELSKEDKKSKCSILFEIC